MVLLLLELCSSSPAAEVELTGAEYMAMQPDRQDEPEKGPGPWVSARSVRLAPSGDAVRIRAEWTLQAVEPGWVDLALVDSSVRVDAATLGGKGVALKSLVDGRRHLVAFITGPTRMVLEGEVVADLHRGLALDLLPAPVGRIQVVTPDPLVKVTSGGGPVVHLGGSFWTGAGRMTVLTSTQKPVKKTDLLVVGAVGMGVTVSDGSVTAKARIRWRIARGQVESLRFTVQGAGPDLEVTGPRVADWERAGDSVTVRLRQPESALVEVEVGWSSALPDKDEAQLPLPSITLDGVFRTENALQIARDGDREVLPTVAGWEAVPAVNLPEVAQGLVTGTPTSAWVTAGSASGALSLLRFRPVSGPSTIVDVAAFDGALSREGRLLLRAHYTVRNDRGAFLRVTPPVGATIVSARVGGEPARVARDGEVWLVPLLKSVETVQGLLDFPVDLVLLADGQAFAKREERSIRLPSVDADVAVTRVSLTLPVGWANRLDEGEGGQVSSFTEGEGLTYGFKVGDTKVAEADALFQSAVGAWMDNDFDSAQDALDDLRALGGDNENVGRLQSNIDLVLSDEEEEEEGQAVAMQRRVKEQAKARSGKAVAKQEVLLQKADEAYWSGDYSSAESAYQEALDIGENLQRLEQKESVEVSYANSAVFDKLEKSKDGKKKNKKGTFQFDEPVVIAGEVGKLPASSAVQTVDVGDLPDGNEEGRGNGFGAEATGAGAGPAVVEIRSDRIKILEGVPDVDEAPGFRSTNEIEVEGRDGNGELRRLEEEVRDLNERVYRSRTVIDFDGIDVSGELVKPQGGLILTPAPPPPPPPPIGDIALKPAASSRRGRRIGFGMKKNAPAPMAGPPPAAPPEQKALEVVATSMDVVIPTFGETIRYQHLLLPADQAHSVPIRAKKRGNP